MKHAQPPTDAQGQMTQTRSRSDTRGPGVGRISGWGSWFAPHSLAGHSPGAGWRCPGVLVLLILALLPLRMRAHDSPEHVIEWLTVRIHTTGKQADLFWRRAAEYRALGRLEAAASD